MRTRGMLTTAAFICLSAIATPLVAQPPQEQLDQCENAACLAFAYLDMLDYDSAIVAFDEAIRRNPRDATLHTGRGQAFSGSGNDARAISDYDIALRLDPQNGSAYFNRGLSYARQGNDARAIADYDQALRLNVQGLERILAGVYRTQAQDRLRNLNAAN